MLIEKLSTFFADFAVPCTCGATAFPGILDLPDETMNMGSVNILSTMYVLQVQTSSVLAAAIVSGSAITVNGQPFTVRDVLSVDDGVISHLTLSK